MRENVHTRADAAPGFRAGAGEALILVVDDDPALQQQLLLAFTQAGRQVLVAASGPEALRRFAEHPIDFIVLSANLAGMDGYTLCAELRKRTLAPILMLLKKYTPLDERVMAIEQGADGYLTKPLNPAELAARVSALLARAGKSGAATAPPSLLSGELRLDEWKHEVTLRGQSLHITSWEFQLLRYLMRHAGRVITKEELLTRVWPANQQTTQKDQLSRLRVTIHRLRAKIEEDPAHPRYLKTRHGVGYQFSSVPPVSPAPAPNR